MPHAARILIVFIGVCLTLAGLLAALGYLAVPIWSPEPETLAMNTFLAAIAALGLGFGLLLVKQGVSALAEQPGRPVDLPRGVFLLLFFLLALVFGPAALKLTQLALWIFPIFYLTAMAMPVLIVVGFVWRRTREACDRELVVQLTYGALIATTLAGFLELFAFVGVAAVVLVGVSLLPGGADWVQQLSQLLQTPAGLQDPEKLRAVLLTPPIMLIAGLLLVILGPMIEEAIKSLGVPLLRNRLTTRSQAFAWGLAAGAGFALTEGLLNGIMAIPVWQTTPAFPGTGGAAQILGAGFANWDQGILLRAGASLLHSLTGGLMGLGWYACLRERRPWLILGTYVLSVGIHAWWNGLVLVQALGQALADVLGNLPIVDLVQSLFWLTALLLMVTIVGLTIRRPKGPTVRASV